MATDYRIIAGGTTYYLKPSGQARVPFTGSGTPWTAQATTPFEIQMNDVTGRFSPRVTAGQRMVGVGANVPVLTTTDITYEAVEWPLPIAISATTREVALDARQALLRALDNWAVGLPAQLYVHPDGVTAAVYWEVLGATWQEVDRSWNEEHGRGFLRGVVTLLVREFGGRDAFVGDVIFSSQAFTNTSTGDTVSMGTSGTGDLTNEGQPLNISITPSATQARFHVASIHQQLVQTSGFAGTTVGTSYTTIGTGSMNLSALLTRPALAVRLLADVNVTSTGSTDRISGVQALLQVNSGGTYATIEHPAISLTVGSRRLYDLGDVPVPAVPFGGHDDANLTFGVTLQMKKSSAADTVTATVSYIEVLLYYEFCTISAVSVTSSEIARVVGFASQTGRTSLPLPAPVAVRTGSSQTLQIAALEGQAPRYRRGASLWIAGLTEDAPGGTKNNAHTFTVSAQQCPLWRSIRSD